MPIFARIQWKQSSNSAYNTPSAMEVEDSTAVAMEIDYVPYMPHRSPAFFNFSGLSPASSFFNAGGRMTSGFDFTPMEVDYSSGHGAVERMEVDDDTAIMEGQWMVQMDLFKDKYLVTKEYFEKKPVTPEEETLTEQLNLTPLDKKEEENEEETEIPGRLLGHEALQGKIVGLYFSAGWCPPCQQFTPLLCNLYDELQNRKANFEVVFLSFDKTEEEMETYFRQRHREWYALPFDDAFRDELKAKYNVTAVPKFIIINKDGEVISSKGRKEVQDKGVIAFRNWTQAASTYEAKQSQTQATAENTNNPEGAKAPNETDNSDAT